MKHSVVAVLVALSLAACAGTSFKWDQARSVKQGMTEAELQKIMGAPYLVKASGDKQVWVYAHGNALGGSQSVSYILQDKKVVEVPPIPDSF